MLAFRLATVEHLVDIGGIAELRGVAAARRPRRRSAPAPATPRSSTTRRSPPRCRCCTLATPLIGHFQIRNRGTIGGSLAHADPAAEYPAVRPRPRRRARPPRRSGGHADDRRPPSSSTACGRPRSSPTSCSPRSASRSGSGRCGFAVEEFARRHGDFAIAGAVVGVELDDAGTVTRCAIAAVRPRRRRRCGPAPPRRRCRRRGQRGRRRRARAARRRRPRRRRPATSTAGPTYRRRIGGGDGRAGRATAAVERAGSE